MNLRAQSSYMSSQDTNRIRVSSAEISQFWAHNAAMPAHQRMEIPGSTDLDAFNPLGLYGDDGRINKSGDKLVLVCMNSLLHCASRGPAEARWCMGLAM